MDDISTITTLDGTTYNIKDSTARSGLLDCMQNSAVSVSDLNDATEIGFYKFTSSAANRPSDLFTSGGSMIVTKYSDDYFTQFAVANNFTNFDVAMRKCRQGTFSSWQSLVPQTPKITRTYYPALEVGGISVSTGANTSQTSSTGKARARTPGYIRYVSGSSVAASTGYDYKFITYTSAGVWVSSSEDWLSGTTEVPACDQYRLLVKNDSISDFTGVTNNFITITDMKSIQERFDEIFARLEG